MHFFRYPTQIGLVELAEDGGALVRVRFATETEPDTTHSAFAETPHFTETPLLREAARQLALYLDGRLREFTVPLAPSGTPFQQSVWKALCSIPYGATACYADIARAIGNPKAVRAVGGANNKNPLPIFIPCHRVIGADGSLTGYAGGLDIKRKVLDIEARPYAHIGF